MVHIMRILLFDVYYSMYIWSQFQCLYYLSVFHILQSTKPATMTCLILSSITILLCLIINMVIRLLGSLWTIGVDRKQ